MFNRTYDVQRMSDHLRLMRRLTPRHLPLARAEPTERLQFRRFHARRISRREGGRRGGDRSADVNTVRMSCPFCNANEVIVKFVCDDYRSVQVQCPCCQLEAFLAVPAIRRAPGRI